MGSIGSRDHLLKGSLGESKRNFLYLGDVSMVFGILGMCIHQGQYKGHVHGLFMHGTDSSSIPLVLRCHFYPSESRGHRRPTRQVVGAPRPGGPRPSSVVGAVSEVKNYRL